MATSPLAPYRVADDESQIRLQVSVVTSALRIESMTPDADFEDGRGAARGILVGLLLSVPFWVGVYAMLF